MRAYGKEWNYNVYSCIYCLYWKGEITGCIYDETCCCDPPQEPPFRSNQAIASSKEKSQRKTKSPCDGCPYGRAAPCIGWCTKEVLQALAAAKEHKTP